MKPFFQCLTIKFLFNKRPSIDSKEKKKIELHIKTQNSVQPQTIKLNCKCLYTNDNVSKVVIANLYQLLQNVICTQKHQMQIILKKYKFAEQYINSVQILGNSCSIVTAGELDYIKMIININVMKTVKKIQWFNIFISMKIKFMLLRPISQKVFFFEDTYFYFFSFDSALVDILYLALSQEQGVFYYFFHSHIHWIYQQLLCMYTKPT